MGAPTRWKVGNVCPEQADRPEIRSEIAADLIEQRGLAGSVRADDQAPFAGTNPERNILGDRQAAEGLLQIEHLECVAGRRAHLGPLRNPAINLLKPGTMPAGITRTMNRNTRPSSMFQRSI